MLNVGETFILFNKQMKGNKRELIQLGVPIFGHIKEEASSNNQTSKLILPCPTYVLLRFWEKKKYQAFHDCSIFSGNIEPIPVLLEGVINHLVQWQLIPEYKKPNGCIIHFFDEVFMFYKSLCFSLLLTRWIMYRRIHHTVGFMV